MDVRFHPIRTIIIFNLLIFIFHSPYIALCYLVIKSIIIEKTRVFTVFLLLASLMAGLFFVEYYGVPTIFDKKNMEAAVNENDLIVFEDTEKEDTSFLSYLKYAPAYYMAHDTLLDKRVLDSYIKEGRKIYVSPNRYDFEDKYTQNIKETSYFTNSCFSEGNIYAWTKFSKEDGYNILNVMKKSYIKDFYASFGQYVSEKANNAANSGEWYAICENYRAQPYDTESVMVLDSSYKDDINFYKFFSDYMLNREQCERDLPEVSAYMNKLLTDYFGEASAEEVSQTKSSSTNSITDVISKVFLFAAVFLVLLGAILSITGAIRRRREFNYEYSNYESDDYTNYENQNQDYYNSYSTDNDETYQQKKREEEAERARQEEQRRQAQKEQDNRQKTENNRQSGNNSHSQSDNSSADVSNWFRNCNTKEQLNSRYKNLAKTFHPDTGSGDEEIFKSITNEYNRLSSTFS